MSELKGCPKDQIMTSIEVAKSSLSGVEAEDEHTLDQLWDDIKPELDILEDAARREGYEQGRKDLAKELDANDERVRKLIEGE